MKILMVHNYYRENGGEETAFATESALLREHGHEVIPYTEDNHQASGESPWVAGANAVWSRRSQRALASLLEKTQPDVVHFHNTFLRISPAAYYTCQEHGVPVVQTLHNYRPLCPAGEFFRDGHVCEQCLGKTLTAPAVIHGCWHGSRAQSLAPAAVVTVHHILGTWQKQVDLYIAVSDFTKRKFIAGGFPADKITVKPNFVAPDPGAGAGDGGFALFAGRLSAGKGVPTLLNAWKRLGGRIPLVIAGDGPLAGQVEQAARDDPAVRWLGALPRAQVIELMGQATFLVFPSQWYENFPFVLVESFSRGRPVLASDLGAPAEIVEEGRTGLHFRTGDATNLAEKAVWAWEHPAETAKMGRQARNEYEQKYTGQQNYHQLVQLYKRAREEHGARDADTAWPAPDQTDSSL